MTCIYCRNNEKTTSFSGREHVIPKSFGAFEDNLVLQDSVCDGCNKYFADNLELKLSRDTYEGLLRFQTGLKKQSEYKSLGKRSSLVIRISEGIFKNAYAFLCYSKETGKLELQPLVHCIISSALSFGNLSSPWAPSSLPG